MLEMTDQAVDVIRGIVADSEVGPNGGLRITGSNEGNGEAALEFELAPEPLDGDEVVRAGGAVVFMDETAAAVLADKTLDVHSHGDHFHFSIDEQGGDQPA
jgi:iron-sulfur cluster assembly protein